MTTWVQVTVYALVIGLLVYSIADGGNVISQTGCFSFIAIVALVCTTWRCRVDAEGFSYRSTLGIPRAKVPYNQIVAAELITVYPDE